MAKSRPYLPETPEELTASWLSTALGGEVQAVQQKVLGDGQGFMGDVVLLHLESPDPSVPRAVVAKLPKKANRVMGELLGVYEREIMFFREFAHDLPVRAPKLFFSEFDRDKGSEKQGEILRSIDRMPAFMSTLIGALGTMIAGAKKRRYLLLIEFFEDMHPGDQLAGLDVSACQQVLRSIAPLHKKYWQQPQLKDHFWLLELDIDARLRQGIFKQHVDAYAQIMGPGIAPHLDWLQENGEALTHRFVQDAPSTLIHCDLRLDNVVFNGDDCAFIDFQLVRHGPAAYDVAYFVTSALHENASPEEEQAVLDAYFSALNEPDYSFEQFMRDYHRGLMVVLAGLSGAEDVELGNDRGQNMMAAWLRRLAARVSRVDPTTLLTHSS